MKKRVEQSGYMLITLTLALALVAIGMLALLADVSQQIRRDREEELCHRGTMYMRAIQLYYRRFGRYPSRIEDLENTDNMRFLRKRYKDPMSRDPQTGQERDFKLLHPEDLMATNGIEAGRQTDVVEDAGPDAPIGSAGQDGPGVGLPGSGRSPSASQNGNSLTAAQRSDFANGGANSAGSSKGGTAPSSGGPILGVASTSKAKTIREYNAKNHYSDWYFIYVYNPNVPPSGLLVGPWRANNVLGGDDLGQSAAVPGQVSSQTAAQ